MVMVEDEVILLTYLGTYISLGLKMNHNESTLKSKDLIICLHWS